MFLSLAGRLSVWADGAQGSAPATGLFDPTMLIMIVVMVAVFYFFILRPEQKRKKAALQMRNDLMVGDTITTIGGIIGRVIAIKDETLTLEIGSDRTKVTIMRWAMQSKGEQTEEK